MKILEVVPVFSDPFGGPVAVVRSISKELAKRHEVVVYTTTALDPWHDFGPKEEKIDGYRVIYFKRTFRQLSYIGILGQLNLSYGMMQAIKQNLREFDVVHVHSWQQFPDVLVHHYATKYDVPYVLQVHGSLPNIMAKQLLKRVFDISFGRRLLRDSSKVIALSRAEAQHYRDAGVPQAKIVVIPNGIDLSEYVSLPPPGYFKEQLGLDKNEKMVLYLGRIHKIKGIDILVRAFASIAKVVNAKLVIVGPNDGYLGEIKSIIRDLALKESVLIFGPLYGKKKLEAYVDADVYVLPSMYETFPMSVLESVACRTPVILTTNCEISDYFKNKVGVVVEPNSRSLSEGLLEMLQNTKLRLLFKRNCQIEIENFDISKVVLQLEDVFKDLCAPFLHK